MKLRLFLYLKTNKITVEEMSEKVGCSRSHLSKMMHGKLNISKMMALSIEKATHGEITQKYLLGNES